MRSRLRAVRAGWTLSELIVSLAVTAVVVTLATHIAVGQLRLIRGAGEIAALRNQLGGADAIVASLLWAASPEGGDIRAAMDSAVELDLTVGSAIACSSSAGRIVVPSPPHAAGNALAGYVESPEEDDRVDAYFADSAGGTWLRFHVAALPSTGGSCPGFPAVTSTWTLDLREPIVVPAGTFLHFLRPMRLSLYRASDNRWYLGAKDWNGAAQRFNTIQPVAGPLASYSPQATATGLRFGYHDASGAELNPVELSRIAAVRVVSRGQSGPVRMPGVVTGPGALYDQTLGVFVPLRNTR